MDTTVATTDYDAIDEVLDDLENLKDHYATGSVLHKDIIHARFPFIAAHLAALLGDVIDGGVVIQAAFLDSNRVPWHSVTTSHHLDGFATSPHGIAAIQSVKHMHSQKYGEISLRAKFPHLELINDSSSTPPFSNTYINSIKPLTAEFAELRAALTQLFEYEELGPPQGASKLGYFSQGAATRRPLAHAPPEALNDAQFEEWLQVPLKPVFWEVCHAQHSYFSPGELRKHIDNDPFLDPTSGYHFGRPNGSRYILAVLIKGYQRVFKCQVQEEAARMAGDPPVSFETLSSGMILAYLAPSTRAYTASLRKSADSLKQSASEQNRSNLGALEYHPMASYAVSRAAAPIPTLASVLPSDVVAEIRKEAQQRVSQPDFASPATTLGRERLNVQDERRDSQSRGSGSRQSSAGSKRPLATPSLPGKAAATAADRTAEYSPPKDLKPSAKKQKGKAAVDQPAAKARKRPDPKPQRPVSPPSPPGELIDLPSSVESTPSPSEEGHGRTGAPADTSGPANRGKRKGPKTKQQTTSRAPKIAQSKPLAASTPAPIGQNPPKESEDDQRGRKTDMADQTSCGTSSASGAIAPAVPAATADTSFDVPQVAGRTRLCDCIRRGGSAAGVISAQPPHSDIQLHTCRR
ncbi:hypothetical protein FS749_006277 [Ceratobasidium sp. UAMH 11750]|nr:hypothetical protein FS749_006277 [Ceratobasidium sp. UAMH 11750]